MSRRCRRRRGHRGPLPPEAIIHEDVAVDRVVDLHQGARAGVDAVDLRLGGAEDVSRGGIHRPAVVSARDRLRDSKGRRVDALQLVGRATAAEQPELVARAGKDGGAVRPRSSARGVMSGWASATRGRAGASAETRSQIGRRRPIVTLDASGPVLQPARSPATRFLPASFAA